VQSIMKRAIPDFTTVISQGIASALSSKVRTIEHAIPPKDSDVRASPPKDSDVRVPSTASPTIPPKKRLCTGMEFARMSSVPPKECTAMRTHPRSLPDMSNPRVLPETSLTTIQVCSRSMLKHFAECTIFPSKVIIRENEAYFAFEKQLINIELWITSEGQPTMAAELTNQPNKSIYAIFYSPANSMVAMADSYMVAYAIRNLIHDSAERFAVMRRMIRYYYTGAANEFYREIYDIDHALANKTAPLSDSIIHAPSESADR